MHTMNMLAFALSSVLLVACDDGLVDAGDEDLGPVSFRSCPGGLYCGSGGNVGNTNIVGQFSAQHMPKKFNKWVGNPGGALMITSATVMHNDVLRSVSRWDVTNNGNLRLFYEEPGVGEVMVKGEAATGAEFFFEYNPHVGANFTGMLRLWSVSCDPGQYDPNFTVCSYTMLTDVVPYDIVRFPLITAGLYATCEDNDDGGTLIGDEKYSLVIAKNTALDLTTAPGVLSPNDNINLLACNNGAASKPQRLLNVTNDYLHDPHPRALDSSQPNALLRAFMAIVDGVSTTAPGMLVCFRDELQGFFDTDNCSPDMQFEGAYDANGMHFRNGNGVHRHYPDPTIIYGWPELPIRSEADYYVNPGDPSIGVWTIPAE